jgi:hypothetical protein
MAHAQIIIFQHTLEVYGYEDFSQNGRGSSMSSITGRLEPNPQHHFWFDVWLQAHFPGTYTKRVVGFPAIELEYDKHLAAHAAGRDWIQARFGTRAEWQVPWKDVSMKQMQELADHMAQAAGVPVAKRREISRAMCAWLGVDYQKRRCIKR